MGLWQQITSAVEKSFQELIRALIRVLPAIGAGVVVLCVFWALALLVRRLARVAAKPLYDETARRLVDFALKAILSNLVSGMLLLAMQPFEIGDQIAIGDTEGTVENIELRAPQIRTYAGWS